MKKNLIFVFVIILLSVLYLIVLIKNKPSPPIKTEEVLIPTIIPSPTATSTPTTISFEDMNKNFGPCVRVNVLMFHHVQTEEEAKAKNQTSLTVAPEYFRRDLQYLKEKNYSVIEPKDLIDFFAGTKQLSGKLAMITLDDGYEDNLKNAFPILNEFGFKATIFTPTGLLNNPDYLTWDEMNQMRGTIYFGNHTWSHHSASGTLEKLKEEINLADTQLKEKGFNDLKVFAYPYGSTSQTEFNILKENEYNLAFTTKYGNIMCKQKKFELPRIRIGNAPLNQYGL